MIYQNIKYIKQFICYFVLSVVTIFVFTKGQIILDIWVCVWNGVYFCESCAVTLSTEDVLSIKKYSHLTEEEKSIMKLAGNTKFKILTHKLENKYYCNQAISYRIQLALSQFQEIEDESTQPTTPLIEKLRLIDEIMEKTELRDDYDWVKIQYQILYRNLKKTQLLNKVELVADKILDQIKPKESKPSLNTIDAFKSLLKNQ